MTVTAHPHLVADGQRRASRPVPLYRPMSWAVLRAPLLPAEDYLRVAGAGRDGLRRFLDDDLVRASIAVGSPDLLDAVDRGGTSKERDQQDSSLLRYLVRMSSRPTPYGMFAGVALLGWGERTTAQLGARPRTHSRPDMVWLLEMLASAGADLSIRRELRVSANRAVVRHGGRIFVTDQSSRDPKSVRATPAVVQALRLAARPIRYQELVEALLSCSSSATTERVAALVDELLRESLLFTELRPSLLTADPATDAALLLRSIGPARQRAAALGEVLDDLSRFDDAPPGGAAPAYTALRAKARALQPDASNTVQVDMTWPVSGAITVRIADAAARAAETLLSLSPSPSGPAGLQSYKRVFESRYGHHRYVPILELLDPAVGIGPPGAGGHSSLPPDRAGRRGRRLLDLAVGALRDRQTAIELTDDDLDHLRTTEVLGDSAPLTLELSVFVLADSVDDIDGGRFRLVVGPNLGAPAAGRNLGRFADILGAPALAALQEVAEHEARLLPDRVWAEVSYLPGRARSANVAVRPAVRPFQVVSVLGHERSGPTQIPLDELAVGLDRNRLRVVWTRDGTEVVPCSGHMLNSRGAPAAIGLLDEVARDGLVQTSHFDWGPASSFPALPRVSYGELVLQPARWSLDRQALRYGPDEVPLSTFAERFEAWRDRWSLPRRAYLAFGDNRLLLDLDRPSNVAEVRRELGRLRPGGSLVLQEALPGPEHAWLPGPRGRYLCELVVPLVRTSAPPADTEPVDSGRVRARRPPAQDGGTSGTSRTLLPGSEWLYAKLYVPEDVEDDVLTGAVREFTELALMAGAADAWFFLRYADSGPHLRLRFHGDPQRLTDVLLPRLFAWVADLHAQHLCTSLVLDTYDREIERYGGDEGVDLVEAVYCADSPAVLELLQVSALPGTDLDRLILAAVSVDHLLDSLGLDPPERMRWYSAQVRDRRLSSQQHRQRGNTLRELLSTPGTLSRRVGGEQAQDALTQRRKAIAPLGAELERLIVGGDLTVGRDGLLGSLVHLHCNRLLGRNADEDLPLGLLQRTWQGLLHSSAASGATVGGRRGR